MKGITTLDAGLVSFEEENLGDLTGKEGYLVEPGTAEGTVKLLATAGNEIGAIHEKPDLQSKVVLVQLLNKEGTLKLRAGGVIAKGGRVKGAVGGKVVASTELGSIGKKLTQGNSADGDLIEVIGGREYSKPTAEGGTIIATGIHTWAGGAATSDSIAVSGLEATDIIHVNLIARASTETLVLAANDAGNDQIDLTLSANGTNGTTKLSYTVIRPAS